MPNPDGVIPSGSMPVNNEPEDPNEGPQGNSAPAGDKPAEGGEKETPYLGDWKTREDAEKGHQELMKKLGSQGEEMGTLRQQNKELIEALTKIQARETSDPNTETKTTGTEAQLNAALEEYGKLNFYEDETAAQKGQQILAKVVQLSAQMAKEEALEEAGQQFQGVLEQRDVEAGRNKFLEANPDFIELQDSGALQSIIDEDPMHDDFSAFYASKLNAATAEIADLNKQIEDLKTSSKLAEGEENTRAVFTRPGANLRTPNTTGPKTPAEIKASMMAAVRALGK